ncbi:hypothetical protein [Ramlibacter albus]|uniref:STAS/SEC14 domain-containing protein n=1 Tax=Ramlibacter albus TaxID=2079448 RepID=A0A923M372_9BURK|nr:hypothetical protein [Ramlibacter albus]MBC5763080.1 hypothetical protein [Ramlibacter albus]
MSFDFDFTLGPRFATFTVRGPATMENFGQLLCEVHVRTNDSHITRVMVNLQATEGGPPFTEQFRLGEMVALRLSHLERLASVVRPEYATGTSSKVANSLGFQLRVFTDVRAAEEWLAT